MSSGGGKCFADESLLYKVYAQVWFLYMVSGFQFPGDVMGCGRCNPILIYLGRACLVSGKEACNEAVARIHREARRANGVDTDKGIPLAKESDQFLLGLHWVSVPVGADDDEYTARILWGVGKGDLWIEHTLDTVKHCIQAIRDSPKEEKKEKPPEGEERKKRTGSKASPKKRARKRKSSQCAFGMLVLVTAFDRARFFLPEFQI